jgi:O-antigen ligase
MSSGSKRREDQTSSPSSGPADLAASPAPLLEADLRRRDLPRAAARGFLVALPLVLPFEAPLFSVGPLVITSAELALYLTLAAWGLGVAAALARAASRRGAGDSVREALGRAARDPVARAVALWFVVLGASALAAPAYRPEALKFTLRSLSGGLLFFAARDLVRSADDARRVAAAIAGGALLSAAAALLERVVPEARLWRLFRPATFTAMGLQRASGAFAYPTIAAMYWEAALALVITAPLLAPSPRVAGAGRHRWGTAAALGALLSMVLSSAMLLSVTRTSLVGAALACLALLVLAWRMPAVRVTASATLVLLAVLIGCNVMGERGDSRMGERLRWWRDGTWFRVRYIADLRPLAIATEAPLTVPVTVENTGSLAWPHTGRDAVYLSYHWQKSGPTGSRLEFEGLRTLLPAVVPAGGKIEVKAKVTGPQEPGRYLLRWDLVRETVTWFSQLGNPTADQVVDVRRGPRPAKGKTVKRKIVSGRLEDLVGPSTPGRGELWRAAWRLWREHPLLGVGPDNFRRLYADVLPPSRDGQRFRDDRLHANNFYIETLTDLGLAGLLALGLLMANIWRVARARAAAGAGVLALVCAIALGTFFVHGVLDYFLEFTPTYGLFWLLVALTTGAWRAPGPSPAPPDSTASAPLP